MLSSWPKLWILSKQLLPPLYKESIACFALNLPPSFVLLSEPQRGFAAMAGTVGFRTQLEAICLQQAGQVFTMLFLIHFSSDMGQGSKRKIRSPRTSSSLAHPYTVHLERTSHLGQDGLCVYVVFTNLCSAVKHFKGGAWQPRRLQ